MPYLIQASTQHIPVRHILPQGYQVISAGTAEEALDFIREDDLEIDLLLTDVILPSLKGHELAKKARKKRPDLEVIYMSGYMCPSISEDAEISHEKYFLQKPFVPSQVKKILRGIFR